MLASCLHDIILTVIQFPIHISDWEHPKIRRKFARAFRLFVKQKMTSHQNKWRKKPKMILLYFKTVFVRCVPVKEMFLLVPSA